MSSFQKSAFGARWVKANQVPSLAPLDVTVFRPWQTESTTEILSHSNSRRHSILNVPTGGGKSRAICYLSLERLTANKKLKVIISVPQNHIGGGFLGGMKYSMMDGTEKEWLINHNLCTGEDGNKIQRLIEFIEGEVSDQVKDRVLICSHTTFSQAFSALKDVDSLKDIDLWIDEAHHISSGSADSNNLGIAVRHFCENDDSKNLSVNMTTATLFRADKSEIIPDGFVNKFYWYKLTYDKHFEENCYYLKSFNYNFMFDEDGWVESIRKIFVDSVKKTIIFIPRPNSKASTGCKFTEVQKVLDSISGEKDCKWENREDGPIEIERNGEKVCVIDLVDDRDIKLRNKRDEFIRNHPDKVDVVINICKFTEGADWPEANRAVIVGKRGSLTETVQSIGRLFRDHESKSGKSVEVIQLFSWIDKNSLESGETKENLNDYIKGIYASLILESIIDPPKDKNGNGGGGWSSAYGNSLIISLLERMTESEYFELIDIGIRSLLNFSVDNEGEVFTEGEYIDVIRKELIRSNLFKKIGDLIDETSGFIYSMCMKKNRWAGLVVSPNASCIDFDSVNMDSPVNFLLGFTSFCGISTLKEFRNAVENSSDGARRTKEMLLNMARNGEKKPHWNHRLSNLLRKYTTKGSGCYDAVFDAEVRKLAPQWFIRTASDNKEELIIMAMNGEPKPSKHSKLGIAFRNYTGKTSKCRDVVFDKRMWELAPQWREDTMAKKKEILIDMARRGEPRPSSKTGNQRDLGRALCSYTNKNSKNYNAVFYGVVMGLAPKWIICNSDDKVGRLIAMAKNGEPRPGLKHKMGNVLSRYTSKKSKYYHPFLCAELEKFAPQWLITIEEKKERLLEMARNGEPKPMTGRHEWGRALRNYTSKKTNTYDAIFDAKVRALAPQWFTK